MKKTIFVSAMLFVFSLSYARFDGENFLDEIQTRLFTGETFSSAEEARLLELSSE